MLCPGGGLGGPADPGVRAADARGEHGAGGDAQGGHRKGEEGETLSLSLPIYIYIYIHNISIYIYI